MILAFTARLTTKDVDAIFQPTQVIRTLAQGIAAEQNLSVDWLNGLHNIIQPREFQWRRNILSKGYSRRVLYETKGAR